MIKKHFDVFPPFALIGVAAIVVVAIWMAIRSMPPATSIVDTPTVASAPATTPTVAPPIVAKADVKTEPTPSVVAVLTPEQLMTKLERAWAEGNGGYKLAVSRLADEYASLMDKDCNVSAPFDFGPAVAAHSGVDARLVGMQVITLACMKMHDDGPVRAARVAYARM